MTSDEDVRIKAIELAIEAGVDAANFANWVSQAYNFMRFGSGYSPPIWYPPPQNLPAVASYARTAEEEAEDLEILQIHRDLRDLLTDIRNALREHDRSLWRDEKHG